MYSKDTVYIVGNSRTTSDNPITYRFNSFFIGFVVNLKDGEIVDVGCSATISLTEEFIKSIFMGKNLKEYDPLTEEEVKARYHGSSQKAIIVAYKDAVKKYNEIAQKDI